MQSLPCRYHGQHRYFLVGNNLQQCRTISATVDEPVQGFVYVCWLEASSCLYAHSLGQLDEVGILLVCVRKSVFIEETLPLRDHALFFIIQDDNFDADVEMIRRAQLCQRHVERS